jgi:hypothetical protein
MKQIKCRICKVDKDILHFNVRKDNKLGHRTECRECQSINQKEHYKNNRLSKLEKQKIYQTKNHHIRKYREYLKKDIEKFNTILDFSINELKNRLKDSCFYCGETKSNRGLDRKDNNIGHTLQNTLVCCELCNMTRGNRYSVEEMTLLGKVIKKIKDSRNETN